jgi:D-sedoheptulose 7-phosphate isomerase
MKKVLQKYTDELKAALENCDEYHEQILTVIRQLREAFAKNKIVYVAGNGGSATLAQHFSDEAVGRYKADRDPLSVVALTADSAVITCIGNDYGYDEVFARQIQALGREGDMLIAYSTSGNSPNILKAVLTARDKGMSVIGFTGSEGRLRELADHVVTSPGKTTARIQELDLHAIHLIFEAFEPENVRKEA